jgi:hypothetical protein
VFEDAEAARGPTPAAGARHAARHAKQAVLLPAAVPWPLPSPPGPSAGAPAQASPHPAPTGTASAHRFCAPAGTARRSECLMPLLQSCSPCLPENLYVSPRWSDCGRGAQARAQQCRASSTVDVSTLPDRSGRGWKIVVPTKSIAKAVLAVSPGCVDSRLAQPRVHRQRSMSAASRPRPLPCSPAPARSAAGACDQPQNAWPDPLYRSARGQGAKRAELCS